MTLHEKKPTVDEIKKELEPLARRLFDICDSVVVLIKSEDEEKENNGKYDMSTFKK